MFAVVGGKLSEGKIDPVSFAGSSLKPFHCPQVSISATN